MSSAVPVRSLKATLSLAGTEVVLIWRADLTAFDRANRAGDSALY